MIKMSKKSQAALEFIMTYGWAILVVLVAIGALSYFGVLNPGRYLPAKCTLQPGIACTDSKVTNGGAGGVGQMTIRITNSIGSDISGITVKTSNCGTDSSTPSLVNGASATYTITCAATLSTSKYSGQLNVSYVINDTGISHNNVGDLIRAVE